MEATPITAPVSGSTLIAVTSGEPAWHGVRSVDRAVPVYDQRASAIAALEVRRPARYLANHGFVLDDEDLPVPTAGVAETNRYSLAPDALTRGR